MNLLLDGRRALFADLIDYAGIFPPASLSLTEAVAEYRRARSGPHGWLLGRFLCPTSRLEDLAAHLTASMQADEAPWRVSAIFDEPLGPAAMHTSVFERYMDPAATVELIEAKTPRETADGRTVEDAIVLLAPVAIAATSISPSVTPFLEIGRGDGWESGFPNALQAISRLSLERLRPIGAKLRTGGLIADAFPSPEQVALFIESCVQHDVPLKATAGLHHPFRHYDKELDVMRHGFLNLLAAAALSRDGVGRDTLVAVINEQDPDALRASPAGLRWRDHLVGTPTLRKTRALFRGYGSCDFDKPIADLDELRMLTPVTL
ncbi:MAG: hypothetical protein U9N84_05180 [Actinomycetota bacterium]|nr:hypothetical protein [Actinomycetota bacterium]